MRETLRAEVPSVKVVGHTERSGCSSTLDVEIGPQGSAERVWSKAQNLLSDWNDAQEQSLAEIVAAVKAKL